tara:strand:- start:1005 stop:2891 length:1887 start_codon:yes stop_codon:yes gene_type:complete
MDLHKHTANELLNIDGAKTRQSDSVATIDLPVPNGTEMVTADVDRNGFSGHNWTVLGGGTLSVDRSDLKLVSDGGGGNDGMELALANIKGEDGSLGIVAGSTYIFTAGFDQTAGKTTPAITVSLGGTAVPVKAIDSDPFNGTINSIAQHYKAVITTVNDTGTLQVYQPASDNDASTTFLMDQLSLKLINDTSGTQHLDVSGKKYLEVYSNRNGLLYSFSTAPKDITGSRGANSSGYGSNYILNSDFESGTSNWTIAYGFGLSSGLTYAGDNTSSPLSGSKDAKVTNASDGISGIRSNSFNATGRDFKANTAYKVSFKYKTNFDGGNQPDALMAKVYTSDGGGGSNRTYSRAVYSSATPELIPEENVYFTADADDADLQGDTDLTGFKVRGVSDNNIALASGVLTYTINNGTENTYIQTKEVSGAHILEVGESYLIRVTVDSVSGDAHPVFELGGGYGEVHIKTAGVHEFVWTYGPESIDNWDEAIAGGKEFESSSGTLKRRYAKTGSFAISSFSITKYSVDNKPIVHNLTSNSSEEVVFTFQSAPTEPGNEFLGFFIDNTGSTDSVFQVDDIKFEECQSFHLRNSTSDLSLVNMGYHLIPIPQLGDTIYFNFINDDVGAFNRVVISKV